MKLYEEWARAGPWARGQIDTSIYPHVLSMFSHQHINTQLTTSFVTSADS